jgi:hypothetical protein
MEYRASCQWTPRRRSRLPASTKYQRIWMSLTRERSRATIGEKIQEIKESVPSKVNGFATQKWTPLRRKTNHDWSYQFLRQNAELTPLFLFLEIVIYASVFNCFNLFSRAFYVIRVNMVGYQWISELNPIPCRRVGNLNSTPSPSHDRSIDVDLFLR